MSDELMNLLCANDKDFLFYHHKFVQFIHPEATGDLFQQF